MVVEKGYHREDAKTRRSDFRTRCIHANCIFDIWQRFSYLYRILQVELAAAARVRGWKWVPHVEGHLGAPADRWLSLPSLSNCQFIRRRLYYLCYVRPIELFMCKRAFYKSRFESGSVYQCDEWAVYTVGVSTLPAALWPDLEMVCLYPLPARKFHRYVFASISKYFFNIISCNMSAQ